jgi:hypothetical protein
MRLQKQSAISPAETLVDDEKQTGKHILLSIIAAYILGCVDEMSKQKSHAKERIKSYKSKIIHTHL